MNDRPPPPLHVDLPWPEGAPISVFGGVLGAIVPRDVGGRRVFGLEASASLRNDSGAVHGGALTGFVDEVVGTIVQHHTACPCVTVHFVAAFLRPVRVGDFLVPSCRITSAGRSIVFTEAKLTVGDAVVLTASLVFKSVRRPSA